MTNRRFWQPTTEHWWAHGFLLATQALIIIIFFCGSWWWRPRWVFAETTPDFIRNAMLEGIGSDAYTALSFTRYALTPFILVLVLLWLLTGMRGLRQLVLSGRWYWLLAFGILVFWIFLSMGWSAESSHAAQNQIGQWVFVLLFALVVSCVGPSARVIGAALLAGAIFQSTLGIVQTILQRDLGIFWVDDNLFRIGLGLYEFGLNPNSSGANVIEADGVRFLRAHGITSHPNLLGPSLTMGLFGGWWLWSQPKSRPVASVVYVVVLWGLFLTFSRASMGGLLIGLIVVGIVSLRWRLLAVRHLAALAVLMLLLGGLFYIFYQPLIEVRTGNSDGDDSLEQISVASREIYLEQAETMVRNHPWYGVGIGNFPYVSQQLLQQRPELSIRGDNVHRVYYLAAAEIGIIGFALFVWVGVIVIGFLWRRRKRLSLPAWGLIGGIVAWLAAGWFEFFWWNLMPYQVLFWGTIATLMHDALPDVEEDHPLTTPS